MATDSKPKIVLRASMLSDVGVVRDHNEDAAYIDPEQRFFIVADGMGGHAAGEIASAMAVEKVRASLEQADTQIAEFGRAPSDSGRKDLATLLEQAVRGAHTAVYDRGLREPDKQGMGTTLDVVLIAGPEAFVAHVGDSRTYLLRGGKMAQVTTDHTVAEVLLIEGKLSPEEAQVSPLRTILVNAIGVADDVGVEMAHVRLRTGDQLLLSSDGLHDYFPSEHEIATHLAGKPEEILARMVELARNRGGHDNITGLVVQVLNASEEGEDEAVDDRDAIPEPVARGDTLPFGEVITPPAGHAAVRDEPGPDSEDEGDGDGDAPASSDEGKAASGDAGDEGGGSDDDESDDDDGDREQGEAKAKGKNGSLRASPPVVPETRVPPAADDDFDEGYVEDDTLVGHGPDGVKPPAPKADATGGEESGDGERPDPEAKLD